MALASLFGAFTLGRATAAGAPLPVRGERAAAGPGASGAANTQHPTQAASRVELMPEAKVERVRAELRQLNLANTSLLPAVCRMARWLEAADEDALLVALVEGETIVGRRSAEVLLPLVFLRWGEIDRAGALDAMSVYYGSQPAEGASPIEALEPFFSEWAREDPRAALGALATLELPRNVRRPVNGLLDEICGRDARSAAMLCAELATSADSKSRSIGFAMSEKVIKRLNEVEGTEPALAWAVQQAVPALRTQSIVELTEALLESGSDSEAILAYAALGASADTSDADFMKEIAGAMVRVNPVNARSWALALPGGEVRAAAIGKMAEQITEKQSAAQALEWLQACGSQADFDGAYKALAEGWPADDPAGKYRCAQGIADPAERSWLKYQVAFDWMRRDEAAAVQALPSAMTVKLKQVQELSGAYRNAMAELFPGAEATFILNPQAGVAADELED